MTPAVQALSTALLHFVWQGMIVGVVLALTLFFLRKSSAALRYFASCLALLAMLIAPVVTGFAVYQGATQVRSMSTSITNGLSALPAIPAVTAQVIEDHYEWIIPAWLGGVVVFGLRLLWAGGHSYALRRRGSPADSSITSLVLTLCERAGIHGRIEVLLSSMADVPSVVGWMRPVILLPPAAILGLTPRQLEAVIAHELAHIRRHDYVINILQITVETLFFYHPAVWWVSSRIRYERELCCDDFAVQSCGDAVMYARALAQLEKLRPATPILALGAARGPLLHRVQRLVGSSSTDYGPSKLACAVGLLVGVLSLGFFMNNARAQQEAIPRPGQDKVEPLPLRPEVQEPVIPTEPLPPTPLEARPETVALPAAPSVAPAEPVPPAAPVLQASPALPAPPASPAPSLLALLGLLQKPESQQQTRWVTVNGRSALLFSMDGKNYMIQDQEVLDRVRALRASQENETETNIALARRRLSELNAAEAALEVAGATRDVQARLRQMEQQLRNAPQNFEEAQKSLANAQLQLNRLQAENTKLEMMMRSMEEQVLQRQAELAKAEALEARQAMERIQIENALREAVRNGKAEIVP